MLFLFFNLFQFFIILIILPMTGSQYEQTLRRLLNADIAELIVFFQSRGILKSTMMCCYCQQEMVWTKKKMSLDQYVWKCQVKTCSKYKTNLSIRTGSFLTISLISLRTWLDVLYRWSNEESMTLILKSLTFQGQR